MSQTITKDSVLKILEGRYDYQSARNVMERALKEAGLAKKDSLSASDLDSFCEAMEAFSTSVTSISESLRNTLGGGGAKKDAKADDKADDKKDAKADDKKDAKADDKKDAKADDKKDDKADAKKSGSSRKSSTRTSKKSSTTNKKASAKKDDDKADDKKTKK